MDDVEDEMEYDELVRQEKDTLNRENQRLLRNRGCHRSVLEMIQFIVEPEVEQMDSYAELIDQCYLFLIRFCRQNTQNQSVLFQYIETFLQDMASSVLAVCLVKELYRHNKNFLNRDVSTSIKEMVRLIEDMENNDPRKGQILNSLQVFVKYRNKIIKKNQ